jgi:secreted trypsin-like serine protease
MQLPRFRKSVCASAVALAALVGPAAGCAPESDGAASSVEGITNGAPDFVHTSVAAMLVRTPGGYAPVCTGTLVAPRVVLTAGHCVALVRAYGLGPPVWVTFDQRLSATETVLRASQIYAPEQFRFDVSAAGNPVGNVTSPYDVGVLVLDQPVTDRAYARLPSANLLATALPQSASGGGLRLTIVGYGMAQSAPGATFERTNERRSAAATLDSYTPDDLLLNALAVQDNGGACNGDSGGPAFLTWNGEEYLVGTAVGVDGACHALNWYHRTDTAVAREFLRAFIPLP